MKRTRQEKRVGRPRGNGLTATCVGRRAVDAWPHWRARSVGPRGADTSVGALMAGDFEAVWPPCVPSG